MSSLLHHWIDCVGCWHFSFIPSVSLFVRAHVQFLISSGLVHWEPCLLGGRTRSEVVANIIILFVGVVPGAASAVYKQSYLQDNVRSQISGIYLVRFITCMA